MEQEIEQLQTLRKPVAEILLIEKNSISLQGIESWCVDSEDNIVLTDSCESEVPSNPLKTQNSEFRTQNSERIKESIT